MAGTLFLILCPCCGHTGEEAGVLALSDDGQKHRMPVMTTDTWMDANGLCDHARGICDALVEVVSESKDQFDQTMFRLRVPRMDESGDFDHTTTTFDSLSSGTFRFGGRTVNIFDPIRTGMALHERYQDLTNADRERFVQDEVRQMRREHEQKVSRVFLINGRRRDGRMPDGSLPR